MARCQAKLRVHRDFVVKNPTLIPMPARQARRHRSPEASRPFARLPLCPAGDRVFGPRNLFHTYRNVGTVELKLVIVYTPGGFEQSFINATAMLQDGKDQSDMRKMLFERYGLTRGHAPSR